MNTFVRKEEFGGKCLQVYLGRVSLLHCVSMNSENNSDFFFNWVNATHFFFPFNDAIALFFIQLALEREKEGNKGRADNYLKKKSPEMFLQSWI